MSVRFNKSWNLNSFNFFKKIFGGLVFEKKRALMAPRRRFDPIYWIFYRYIFLKFIKNEGPCCCWCFSASLVSEKILVLQLRVKMLVIYQIVGFFKERYLLSKSEMKLTFCKHINFWRTCQDSQSNIRILKWDKISRRMSRIDLMFYTDLNQSC